MDANTKTLLKVTGGFLLKIVAYTACVTAIHFIINDGAEYPSLRKPSCFSCSVTAITTHTGGWHAN